jgi:hypothetical protein
LTSRKTFDIIVMAEDISIAKASLLRVGLIETLHVNTSGWISENVDCTYPLVIVVIIWRVKTSKVRTLLVLAL